MHKIPDPGLVSEQVGDLLGQGHIREGLGRGLAGVHNHHHRVSGQIELLHILGLGIRRERLVTHTYRGVDLQRLVQLFQVGAYPDVRFPFLGGATAGSASDNRVPRIPAESVEP